MEPSIEIAIPFYGRSDYLREAVKSVLVQVDPRWRLRVYDDNPEPDAATARWLGALGDRRVEYHVNERNLGVSGNFNRCIQGAQAQYVVLMGCDDRLLPDYVATARNALVRAGAPVVAYHPDVLVIDEEGSYVRPLVDRTKRLLRPRASEPVLLRGEPLVRSLMYGTWTYFPAILWRTEALAGRRFDDCSLVVQDVRLLLDLILDGGALCLDPTTTFEYRRHEAAASSVTLSSGERFAEERALYQECQSRLAREGWASASRAASCHLTSRLHAMVVAARCAGRGDVRAGARLLRGHAFAR